MRINLLKMHRYIIVFIVLLFVSCKEKEQKKSHKQVLQTYELPVPVDTKTKTIELQTRQTFKVDDVYASNEFKGARLNGFKKQNDSLLAKITPEITPINNSPWYAFKIWSDQDKTQDVFLKYEHGTHRYAPKISTDFKSWSALDTTKVTVIDSVTVKLQLDLKKVPTFVAAQPVQNSDMINAWMKAKAELPNVNMVKIGESTGGEPINRLEIGNNPNNPTICIVGRQHPPEVTGWFAQKAFVDFLLGGYDLNDLFLKEFNVIVYPLLNPDGVNEGHWRTGLGGVDLNRDWAFYYQKETKKIAESIVEYANTYQSQIVLGIDFHSTYYDVFYENHDPSFDLIIPNFKTEWIDAIKKSMPYEKFKVSEIEMGKPISMDWFSRQFGAAGVTYEIGDDTTHENIKLKAQNAGIAMMELLMKWKREPKQGE